MTIFWGRLEIDDGWPVAPKGVYKTTTAGKTWTKVSALHANLDPLYTYAPQWFGGYTWDPVNDVIYATAGAHPAFKNQLSGGVKSKP